MSLYPVADLQTHAGELAQRLISLPDFSSAAHELLATLRTLASDLISRFTLTRAGINLYEFAYCRPEMRQYKSVYFDILRALRDRQADIDQDAVELLTRVPARRSLQAIIKSAHHASLHPAGPHLSLERCTSAHIMQAPLPGVKLAHAPTALAPARVQSRRARRPRQRLDRPAAETRLLARTRSPRRGSAWPADPDSENNSDSDVEGNDDAPVIFLQRPSRPRQFGIFCRGATRGHIRRGRIIGRGALVVYEI
ncbi:hypothetical protein EVG20_g2239 [Dentipellis fragilis]|uniref:Uncharacterized protein n=1 Tax=Dentipellis fragilis TaxID=205917 RepID=A0A4Y9Z8C4_9AGAM|nr:hypothetical protein EVG20_g2239 [Dentipellis fragilis]